MIQNGGINRDQVEQVSQGDIFARIDEFVVLKLRVSPTRFKFAIASGIQGL